MDSESSHLAEVDSIHDDASSQFNLLLSCQKNFADCVMVKFGQRWC